MACLGAWLTVTGGEVLKGKGVQEGWTFFKKEILKAQDQAVPKH